MPSSLKTMVIRRLYLSCSKSMYMPLTDHQACSSEGRNRKRSAIWLINSAPAAFWPLAGGWGAQLLPSKAS